MSRTTRISMAAAALALTLHAGPALAQLSVTDPWVRGTVPTQKATGAFMSLRSDAAAALVGASSPVAGKVELHEMRMDKDIARMRQVTRIELPAGVAVELRPGGYHLMLLDLKQPLKKGDDVPLMLQVQDANGALREVAVRATVRDLTSGHGHGHHDDHQHHEHAHDHDMQADHSHRGAGGANGSHHAH